MNDLLPPPPVPADADLAGFAFTPIFRSRLFGSRFHARATDAEWRAGVTLWLKSWDQVPAGSLPDDDIDLCRLAELGRDLKAWARVKAGAMHGWYKCTDGLLYHDVVAEGINEAIFRKKKHSSRGKKGADARWHKHPDGMQQASDADASSMSQDAVSNGPSNAQAMLGNGNRQGYRKEKDTPPTPPKRGADDDPAFAAFWAAYPRRDDKGHARKAWAAATRKATADAIMAGLARYQFKPEREFQPLPATWLNGERWADQAGAPLLRAVEKTPDGYVPTPMSGAL